MCWQRKLQDHKTKWDSWQRLGISKGARGTRTALHGLMWQPVWQLKQLPICQGVQFPSHTRKTFRHWLGFWIYVKVAHSYWNKFKFKSIHSTHMSYRGEHHLCSKDWIKPNIHARPKNFSCWTTQEIRWESIKIQHYYSVLLKMLPNIKASVKQWPWTKSLQVHCLVHLLKLPVGSHWPHTTGGGKHVSRYQIPQWCTVVAQSRHSKSEHIKGRNHQNSFSEALLVDPFNQHLPLSLSPGFPGNTSDPTPAGNSGDAHTSFSSKGTSCLVGANEVAPSP